MANDRFLLHPVTRLKMKDTMSPFAFAVAAGLASAAFLAAEDQPPPRPIASPEKARVDPSPAEAPATVPVPREETIAVETLSGRESLPAAQLSRLALARGGKELTADGKRFPLEDLIFIRFPVAAPDPRTSSAAGTPSTTEGTAFVLFLRGGGELEGEVRGGGDDQVLFACRALGGEPLRIGVEDVKGLMVTAAGSAREAGGGAWRVRMRNQMAAVRAEKEKDEVILLQEGRVQGILEAFAADGIRFSSDALGDVKIAYEKLRAVILAEVETGTGAAGAPAPSGPRARVTLQDGSLLPGTILAIREGTLSLHSEAAGELAVPLAAVLDLAFVGGRATYLSDLEPALVKEELGAAFRKKMPYRRDANVLGEPMRMAGREYRKGLGVHSYSLLQFDLAGRFARLQVLAGLDESAQPLEPEARRTEAGQVVFRVALDGKTLFEKALSWRDAPVPIDLPVSGGNALALEVDYGGPAGGFNFALDRANWAEARLIK